MTRYLWEIPKRKLRRKKYKDNHREKIILICNITGYICDSTNTCFDCGKEIARLKEIRKK
jgi:hypothetical protein